MLVYNCRIVNMLHLLGHTTPHVLEFKILASPPCFEAPLAAGWSVAARGGAACVFAGFDAGRAGPVA